MRAEKITIDKAAIASLGARWRTLREVSELFWSTADAYAKRRLLLALFLVVVGALLAALTPIALKLIIDALSQHAPATTQLLFLVALYVAGQYLWRCATELKLVLHGYAEQRIRRRTYCRLFDHLVRLPLQFHLEKRTGAMAETAEQGMKGYQMVLQHVVFTVLPVAIEFAVVAFVLLYFKSQAYLLILAVASVAYVAAFHRGAVSILTSSVRVSTSHIEAHAVLTDSLMNHETVKYFDAEAVVLQRYDQALGRHEFAWRQFFGDRAFNGWLVATVFAACLGTSLAYGVRDVVAGNMSVGDFVLVNTYILRLVQPLEMLGVAVRDIAQGLAFLGAMLGVFRESTEEPAGRQRMALSGIDGEVAFQDVTFGYRAERQILRNVSFTIASGHTVAVVGASGAGKSSLVRLLFRLYAPSSGRILLDGRSLADMAVSDVRRAIAVVPQDTVLFHDTIASNIGFGRHGSTRPEIEEAARLARLHDFIMALPEGYETLVGERGLKLSGGERQRVAIARAALKRPRVFVFDEATSSLDSRTERDILSNLNDLACRHTTLVIAHRLSTVVHADQIIVLHQGRVVESGTHDTLLRLGRYYAALWSAQQRDGVVKLVQSGA
jgi:ABC-type transport system involved in Fe-S cluster assembly fused permease/ATPase subunit